MLRVNFKRKLSMPLRSSNMARTQFSSFSVVICLAACTLFASSTSASNQNFPVTTPGQIGKAKPAETKADGEVLTPLTEEERLLSPRDLILTQPDFAADVSFFVGEGFGGYGGEEHDVHKGNRYRRESKFWIFVGEVGKTQVRLNYKDKTYDDIGPSSGRVTDDDMSDLKTLAQDSDLSFVALGKVQMDGHKCIKIEVTPKGDAKKIYLYVARDLKNLVIASQVIEPKRDTVCRLRNISLDVPDGLVDIPAGFKPIERDRWTKVESAKILYKGKVSQDFGVFRAPGGELFIWVNDESYPWHYIVRPQQATVEIAYEGELVTHSGEYIWRTKQTEATSETDYRSLRRPLDGKPIVVTPNSVRFRANSDDQAMIQVSW